MYLLPIDSPNSAIIIDTKKDVGICTYRLSHCQAFALPFPRISNAASPRHDILYTH